MENEYSHYQAFCYGIICCLNLRGNTLFFIKACMQKHVIMLKKMVISQFIDGFTLREYHIICISVIMGGDFYGNCGTNKRLS